MRIFGYLVMLGLPAAALWSGWDDLDQNLKLGLVAAWTVSVLVALIMGITAVYAKETELEDLRDQARIDARMTPKIRELLHWIKEAVGEIQYVVDGMGGRRERADELLHDLEDAAGKLGEFDGIRTVTNHYRLSVRNLFAAFDEAEPGAERRQRWQADKKLAAKLREVLVASCNQVLEAHPKDSRLSPGKT